MSVNTAKEQNHRYSLDIPDRVYTALKVKAAVNQTKTFFQDLARLSSSLTILQTPQAVIDKVDAKQLVI